MENNNFKQYDFENPHWLEKLVDKTIMKYFDSFIYRHFLNFIEIKKMLRSFLKNQQKKSWNEKN